MALKVGELYASMRLDNAAFDKGLDDSGRKFGKLQSVIESGVKAGAKLFAGATTAVLGLGVAALKVGLDYNRMQQSSRAALTTLLGSAEAANAQMDKLDEFARTSPFAKQVFIQAQQQMLGFGVATEKVIPALDAVQNAVAAMGGSNDDIASIVDTLAKMESQGRLSGETLRELGHYGIDAAKIIGESMGKSGEEIRNAASKPGGIPVEEIWDPLVDGLMDRFGGATAKIKEQMDGAADRVKAAWRDIGSVLAEPFIDPKGGGLAVEWTNKLADAMRAAEQKVRPLTTLLLDRFAPGIATVAPLLERAEGAINAWDLSKVNSQLDSLSKYTPLIAGTSAALFALGTTNLPILSSLGFTGINPVVAGLAALVATSPAAREALSGVFSAAGPLAETAKELGITLSDTLMHALDELVPAAGALAVAFVEAGVPLVQSLTPALVALMTAAVPLVDVVASIVQLVADLPTPVLAAGLAFVALMGPLKPVADGLASVAQGFVRIVQQAQVQAVLGNTNIAMGGLARASATAGPAISGVGTALKTAFVSSGIGIAIAGIVAAIGGFVSSQAEAKRHVDDLASSLDEQTGAWTENTHEILYNSLAASGAVEAYQRLGGDVRDLIPYLEGSAEAQARVNEVLADARGAVYESVDAWGVATDAQTGYDESGTGLLRTIGLVEDALGRESEAAEKGAEQAQLKRDAMRGLADSEDDAADATNRHTEALREQQDALLESANASIGQSKALRRQEDAQERTRKALSDLNKTTKDAEASEKDVEQARRAVEAALDDEASAHIDLLGAMQRNNAGAQDMRAATESAREAFIRSARQMGINQQEAEKLADKYGLIPRSVVTELIAEAKDAQATIDRFIRNNSGKVIHVRVQASGQVSYGHAGGGGGPGAPMRWQADGSVTVPSYAGGKMPHHAIIQSAKPGLVQWAEPETHGEAFIPLAPSKRSRSLAIWEETGRRLGVFAAKSFADGGLNASAQYPTAGGGGAGVDYVRLGRMIEAAVERGAARGAADGASSGVRAGFGEVSGRQVMLSRGGGG